MKSRQAELRDAVVTVLRTHGPLTTEDLHPQVQRMLPQICDDSEDRIIEGKSFGKKWKHWVRSAQQALKREGSIQLRDDGRWELL